MNTLLEAPIREAESVEFRDDDARVARRINGSPPNQRRAGARWLEATVRTIDAQRNDLERTHWKKVLRSMQDD